jgi:hypothetical protein
VNAVSAFSRGHKRNFSALAVFQQKFRVSALLTSVCCEVIVDPVEESKFAVDDENVVRYDIPRA